MSFQKYLSTLFAAAALSASPMISMAGDELAYHDQSRFDMSREQKREQPITDRHQEEWGSEESLAQVPEELGEPLRSGYCFTESVIDESTGEIIAMQQICEDMADVA
ncbi:MAG TPA: hypothetical protein VHM64_16945 [Candidatus Binatia bacterium]|nr:hypothetical protein [Candidatus Binatia bacterium]